ncbi:PAS domain-containing protein [Brevundimonas sp. SGAir0440]|uniref:GAF domain-containing hybrid sensor histidine kinase/response regulator n=1 Tax=Brevundimonas sp. SGAir0440 TaxID=2579977 RepID=UPI0010CD176E|nr:PAS domain-containing protein [Brevundimonas sp. SGAir0440]QCQ98171.1 PAS domain S-box protein [Brevundimonas sp. SGAir0440]
MSIGINRSQLAQMFAHAPGFMALVTGPDHRFELTNPNYQKVIGHREVIGRTVGEVLTDAVAQGYLDLLDQVYRTGEAHRADSALYAVQAEPGGEVVERYVDFVFQPLKEDDRVWGIFIQGMDVSDRHRADQALALSEARYGALFAAMATGFCVIEMKFDAADRPVDYRIVEGNKAFEEMTGLVDPYGKWVSEIAPGLEQHWFDLYGGVARTGEPVRFENPADIFGRWYDVQALRIGQPGAWQVAILFNNITERKQSETRQNALLELNDAIRDLTDAGDIAQASAEVLARTMGVSRAGYGTVDTVAETITIARDYNQPGVSSIAGTLAFREHGSYIEDIKRGETVAIDDVALDPRTAATADVLKRISAGSFVNMPLMEQGRVVAMVFVNNAAPRHYSDSDLRLMREVAERVRTATERARSEAALRDSEAQFRVFAQSTPIQIWASWPDGSLYWFNPQVYAYMGAKPGELDGPDGWLERLHPDDRDEAVKAWTDAMASGQVYDAEFRMRRHDGVYRAFRIRAEPVHDEDGRITRWVGTSTDIEDFRRQSAELARFNETLEDQVAERTSALMQAEEALRQSQKMEAVGQLTGGIAHDFNNLLAGISGSLELITNRIAQGRHAEVERFTVAAQGAAKRAAALTHRLLAFSRRQTLDPKPTNPNRLIRGMEDLVRRTTGPGIEVEVVAGAGLWPVLIDAHQLENAVLNLCINARDAMPSGGRLTIETGNRWIDARTAKAQDLEPGQYVSICVSDTGTGMAPEVAARAFEPFFTTKPLGEGTGLGLSMIYGFVRQSGGQVRIYSEAGEGAMICLYLPRHFGEVDDADLIPEVEQAPRAQAGETVMVVDDEPTVRMLVAEILHELGYQCIEASDGAAGLKLLQSGARIDLLVTDVGLPGGMNGRQMADAARIDRPDLKVLFITGYAENAVVGNGHLDPGMHVMTKPFAMEALGSRIRELIEAR